MIKQKQSREVLNRNVSESLKFVMSRLFKSFICRQVREQNISVVAEMSEII